MKKKNTDAVSVFWKANEVRLRFEFFGEPRAQMMWRVLQSARGRARVKDSAGLMRQHRHNVLSRRLHPAGFDPARIHLANVFMK